MSRFTVLCAAAFLLAASPVFAAGFDAELDPAPFDATNRADVIGSIGNATATLDGNTLTVQNGEFAGNFSLPANADKVGVDVVSAGGQVIDHLDLGPQTSGQHKFSWTNASYGTGLDAPKFRITATGAGQAHTATPLMQSTVQSVSTVNGALQLNLQGIGNVPYSSVVSIM